MPVGSLLTLAFLTLLLLAGASQTGILTGTCRAGHGTVYLVAHQHERHLVGEAASSPGILIPGKIFVKHREHIARVVTKVFMHLSDAFPESVVSLLRDRQMIANNTGSCEL